MYNLFFYFQIYLKVFLLRFMLKNVKEVNIMSKDNLYIMSYNFNNYFSGAIKIYTNEYSIYESIDFRCSYGGLHDVYNIMFIFDPS